MAALPPERGGRERRKKVGDYELTTKIGQGTFAKVYIGEKDGTIFAIKVISREKFPDLVGGQGLTNEIDLMKAYEHENIVNLHDHFFANKQVYLVLEFCSGGDLSGLIRSNGKLDERTSVQFLFQLSKGLSFLGDRGVIHRDLKPANILLSDNSSNPLLKIADFGFARHLQATSMASTACGTPLYMAPEIISLQQYVIVSGLIDIFSCCQALVVHYKALILLYHSL